jgi:4-hydroxybenzoate polyprenyltransferase
VDFDRTNGLRSIPVRFGVQRAILISRAMHVLTIVTMLLVGYVSDLGPIYASGVVLVAALLAYEQSLVAPDDLSQVKRAFDLNGYVGILYLLTTATAVYIR